MRQEKAHALRSHLAAGAAHTSGDVLGKLSSSCALYARARLLLRALEPLELARVLLAQALAERVGRLRLRAPLRLGGLEPRARGRLARTNSQRIRGGDKLE